MEQLFTVESVHIWLKRSNYAYRNAGALYLEGIRIDLALDIELSRQKVCGCHHSLSGNSGIVLLNR
jgi:hypothetical protein